MALLGDEVIRPRRTIPLSILLSVLVVAILYVLLQIGVLGAVPWQSLLDSHGQPTTAGPICRRARRRAYVGPHRRRCGHRARFGNRVCIALRQFTRLFAHLVCRSARRRVLPAFAKLHPRKEIPHVALFAVGILSLIASVFTLDQVIAFLTAGIVLDSGRRTGLCARRSCECARSERRFECRSTRSPRSSRSQDGRSHSRAPAPTQLRWASAGLPSERRLSHRRAQGTLVALSCVASSIAGSSAGGPRRDSAPTLVDAGAPRGCPRNAAIQSSPSTDGRFSFTARRSSTSASPANAGRATLAAYQAILASTRSISISSGTGIEPGRTRAYDFTGATDPRRDLFGLLELTHELGFKIDSAARAGDSQRVAQRRISWMVAAASANTTCRCTTSSKDAIQRRQRFKTRMPMRPPRNGLHNAHASWARRRMAARRVAQRRAVLARCDRDRARRRPGRLSQ